MNQEIQVQVQCDKCETIVRFSMEDDSERNIECFNCGNKLKIFYTWGEAKVYGQAVKKVKTKNCKFIPESQREKYNKGM